MAGPEVVGASAITQSDVEKFVGPKSDPAAVVIALRLVDLENLQFARSVGEIRISGSASLNSNRRGMSDATPTLHASVATTGSALPRAPHGRWATCAGRSPGSRLKRLSPTFPVIRCGSPVVSAEKTHRSQLRGQPRI